MFFGQQISWSSGSFCTFPDRDSQIRETTYFKHTSLFKYEVVLKILVSATNQIDHRSITVFEIYNSPRQFSWSMRIALDFTVFKTFIFTVKKPFSRLEVDFENSKTRQFLANCTTVRRKVVMFMVNDVPEL